MAMLQCEAAAAHAEAEAGAVKVWKLWSKQGFAIGGAVVPSGEC